MLELALTFVVGILASIMSGMAGGGAGLISAPFFLLIGLPPQVAVATTKFGALGLAVGSIAKLRQTEYIRKEFVVFLSLLSILAAVLGSRLLLAVSGELVERLVGTMLLVAVPFLLMKDMGTFRFTPSFGRSIGGYVSYFIVLVLQAAFGSGVGMMLMFVMVGLFGFTALEAIATKRIPGLLLAAVSLGIYVANDVVYFGHGLAMLLGMFLGGYIGTHIAIQKGNQFVKVSFAVVVAALGIKFLVGL